ncbi:gamma-glutamylcyclotransferase, partial [bacterium]|nr:gamma-glutamylcyclotransferase [candidate division CSSED10-310 bacterium]
MPELRWYFAYGSNMNTARMAQRCPGARCLDRGLLEGWRFTICHRGVATLVPDERTAVEGVIWLIGPDHEQALDRYEGVATGVYQKYRLPVLTASGEVHHALVYIDPVTSEGTAVRGYMEL